MTYELDVVTTEYSEDTIAEPTKGDTVNPVGVQAILKGRLHIRLGNIGYPIDPKKLSSPSKYYQEIFNFARWQVAFMAFLGMLVCL